MNIPGEKGRLTRAVALAAIICALVLKTSRLRSFSERPERDVRRFRGYLRLRPRRRLQGRRRRAEFEARSTIANIAWSVSPAPLGRKPIAPFCSSKKLHLRRRAARRLGAVETTALLRVPLPVGPGGLGRRLRSRELEPSGLDDQASSSSVPRALIHFRSVTTLFQGRRGAMPCMDENFERPP